MYKSKFKIGDTVYIKPEYIDHFSTEWHGNLKIDTPYTVHNDSYDDMVAIKGVYFKSYEWRFMSEEEWKEKNINKCYADGNTPMIGDIVECVAKDGNYEAITIGKRYKVHSTYIADNNTSIVTIDLDEPHLKNISKWTYKFKLIERENKISAKFDKDNIPVGSVVLAKHVIHSSPDWDDDYETDIGYIPKDSIVEVLSEPPFDPQVGDKVWTKGVIRVGEPKIIKAVIPSRYGNVYVAQIDNDMPHTYKINQLERW